VTIKLDKVALLFSNVKGKQVVEIKQVSFAILKDKVFRVKDWNLIFFLGAFVEFQVTFLVSKLDWVLSRVEKCGRHPDVWDAIWVHTIPRTDTTENFHKCFTQGFRFSQGHTREPGSKAIDVGSSSKGPKSTAWITIWCPWLETTWLFQRYLLATNPQHGASILRCSARPHNKRGWIGSQHNQRSGLGGRHLIWTTHSDLRVKYHISFVISGFVLSGKITGFKESGLEGIASRNWCDSCFDYVK
jgi:hypothetical protein